LVVREFNNPSDCTNTIMTRLLILTLLIVTIVVIEARVVLNRDLVHPKYEKLNRADPSRAHEIKIALKQRNMDILEVRILARLKKFNVWYKLCRQKCWMQLTPTPLTTVSTRSNEKRCNVNC
jgi:hypothetical protein